MPPVQWGSAVTDANGVIDYTRVFKLISAIAGVLGILVALGAALWQLGGHDIKEYTLLGWIITALVAPITGGVAGAGLGKALLGRNGNGTTVNNHTVTVNAGEPSSP